MENNKVNSQQYWNNRFSTGDWDKNKGQEQTRYFYSLLVKLLPDWFKSTIRQNEYSIVDFGCAEGQGIPLLAAELGSHIKGIDFSKHAIDFAKEEFPQFEFEVGDICKYDQMVDVSIMSNIIEHFPNPYEILDRVASITQKYMIVMVPLEEMNLMDEHCFTFLYQNIPTQVRDFQLIHFVEYDCRDDEEQLFLAKQILAVYSRDKEVNQNLTIEQMDGLLSLRKQQVKELQLCLKLEEMDERNKVMLQELQDITQKEDRLFDSIMQLHTKMTDWQNSNKETIQATVQTTVQEYLHAKELEERNEELVKLYRDVDEKYIELVNRFNQLNDTYGLVVEENVGIKKSLTYRIAEKEKEVLDKLHLTDTLKFMLSVRRNGVKESVRQRKAKKATTEFRSGETQIFDAEVAGEERTETLSFMLTHRNVCENEIASEWNETTQKIVHVINSCSHKGIVVYPSAVHWEPMQRPQHFLRAFAEEGYLCFFCEWNTEGNGIKEVEENVYIVYGEENLLPALQDKCPIVLVTYHKQVVFSDLLPRKVLWFDVLDNLDFFDGATESGVSTIYAGLLENADVVTYSADNLKQYVKGREDAIKLNNGTYLADFLIDKSEFKTVDIMERIKEKGNKILGYYGAIEEWFDVQAIEYMLEHTEYEVVLIGRVGINLDKIQNKRLHVINAVPYQELKNYARYFDVAMIPFVVNKLTNSVSPVKFFEYVAQGIPVVSSNIYEMQQYQNEFVRIYKNYDEMISAINFLCNHEIDVQMLKGIAEQNTWKQRVDAVLCAINKKVEGLRAIADISNYGCVAVESVTFFKYDGTTYYSGGAERYLLDLDEVCKELDIQYRVYQYAEYDWVRFYNNVEVIGLGVKENDVNRYDCPLVQEMENTFARETTRGGALNIYSPFYILNQKGKIPSVGISHGISWDSEYNQFTDGNTFWQVNKNIIDAATYCDHMISVDTNTCNWFQTLDYNTGRKIKYIPNYVDNEEFHPEEGYSDAKEKVIITYPRRLYGARGLYVVLEVIDDVLEAYPNVEFHFVGKGFEVDTKHVEKKIKQWGERVKWYSKTPDTMYEIYRYTDIALVPTMYSEGTSLSCLEALSSGNAVISTRVGGLTDLILSGYNGMLVEPNGQAIKEAIFDLLDNPEKMKALKENAVKTAKSFSKTQWKKRWKEAIVSAVGNRETVPYKNATRCLIQLSSVEDMNRENVISVIRNRLENGNYVFIACKNNPLKAKSYKRLQFINHDEDIYFKPEEIINVEDL